MNIALWMIAGLLAVGFLASGAKKLTQPNEKLAASGWGWAERFSPGAVKAIGTLEIKAAAGPPRSISRRFWCRWLPSAWCC
jgi:hypothetical protein